MSTAKKYLISLGILFIIAICGFFYYLSYLHSPSYSFKIFQESINKNDIVLFEKHIDLDNFLSNYFNDNNQYIRNLYNTPDFSSKEKQSSKITREKKILDKTKEKIINEVKGEKNKQFHSEINTAAEISKTKVLTIFKDVKEITEISKENNVAHIQLSIQNPHYNQVLKLNIKMIQLDDKSWKIIKCTNLAQYNTEEQKLKIAKLKELNNPIIDEIEKSLILQASSTKKFSRNNNVDFSSPFSDIFFYSTCNFKNISGKDIKSFNIRLDAYDQHNNLIWSDYNIYQPGLAANKTTSRLVKSNNLYLGTSEGRNIVNKDISTLTFKYSITKIKYIDGTCTEILYSLPWEITSC